MFARIKLNPDNIIEDPETGRIKLNALSEVIDDMKAMWGIDLTNYN